MLTMAVAIVRALCDRFTPKYCQFSYSWASLKESLVWRRYFVVQKMPHLNVVRETISKFGISSCDIIEIALGNFKTLIGADLLHRAPTHDFRLGIQFPAPWPSGQKRQTTISDRLGKKWGGVRGSKFFFRFFSFILYWEWRTGHLEAIIVPKKCIITY